jgi:imidazolonepropionase-like amidohydrolase
MRRAIGLLVAVALAGCAATERPAAPAAPPPALRAGLDPIDDANPFPSSYRPGPSERVAITGATLLTGTGAEITDGTILIADGRILGVGAGLSIPDGFTRIDGRGRWVTPGIIDAHSHLGIWGQPDSVEARNDVNELTDPNTAQVWAEHSIWPQDPGFDRARAAGVTTLMVLPGSGNLFGGRTVTLRNVPAILVRDMTFPGAPQGLKMACGENPSRTYGGRGRSPASRMGNVAGYRRAWIDAADYMRRWDAWRRGPRTGEPPRRDLQLDTLAGVLRGEILVQNHCYRSDEMAIMIDLAREFGYRIRTFHHANEAYKLAPQLAREGICVATWANWWGYKMEVFDAIEENAPIVDAAGGCAIIHSDDPIVTQHLNQEAAAALSAGRRAGLEISEGQAIRWITANPARALGIENETGTLEPGRRADIVLWSANPFSIYARPDRVWIDGAPVFDRRDPRLQHVSDFLAGQSGQQP